MDTQDMHSKTSKRKSQNFKDFNGAKSFPTHRPRGLRNQAIRKKLHIRLDFEMYDCPAFQTLDPVARAIVLELDREFDGYNNGNIRYSVKQGVDRLRVGHKAIRAAFA